MPLGTLEASLFFFAQGDETGTVCDGLFVQDACGNSPNCVLKLFDPNVDATRDGGTFDFTDDTGACNAENGPAFEMGMGAVELCDGMDNDCDRAIDEDIATAGDPCTEGTGACEVAGQLQCRPDRGMVCVQWSGSMAPDVVPGEPAPEACDDADERCCDGIDQDCDGDTDEFLECTPCTVDDDCAPDTDNPDGNPGGLLCVMQEVGGTIVGRCDACQPIGVIADDPDSDHRGCGPNELCCTTQSTARASAFACQPTAFGLEPGSQCTGCGVGCGLEVNGETVLNANGCVDRECRCGFGPACTDPARPYCHLEECVQCRDNADCGSEELCCDGTCVPTDPLTRCATCETGCDNQNANRCVGRECRCGTASACGGDLRECRRGDRPQDAVCVECEVDFNCEGELGRPACFENRCRACREDIDDFCAHNEVASMEGRLQCIGVECFACDPRDHAGCAEASDAPICGPDNACQPCTVDIADPQNRAGDAQCISRQGDRDECVDGRCHFCNPADYSGCSEPSQPVCQRSLGGHTCRGCENDAECDVLEVGGVDKVCAGNGQCQGCGVDDNDGCDPFGTTPICRLLNGNPVCRRCEVDAECPSFLADGEPPMPEGGRAPVDELVFCVSGRCRECDGARAPNGCTDPSQPVCVGGDCVPCARDADCEAIVGNVATLQCISGGPNDGQCRACDPADHAGCDPAGAAPVCDAVTYTCRACRNDADCAGNPDGTACADGTCEECRADLHCDPASRAPACLDNRTCGCANDADCAGNPNGEQCVDGGCAACDPDEANAGRAGGCDLRGDAPYCDPATRTCVGCDGDANRCADNPNGTLCAGDACVACLIGNHDGCNNGELCCGGADPSCVPTDANQCTACAGGGCDVDLADTCGGPDGRMCVCGEEGAPCSPHEICVGGACVECAADGDCGGATSQCVAGFCEECDPSTNDGCDGASSTPICDVTELACRGCVVNAECAAHPGVGDVCSNGRCGECTPGVHTSCDVPGVSEGERLCCVSGGVARCIDADEVRCTGCLPANGCADGEVCTNRQCVPD